MAHWAEIDENNIVTRVLVGDNNDPDEGYQWLIDNLGGTWIKTSYNDNIRKQFAGVGFSYDETNDIFITPKPYLSWVLNENHDWESPVPMPISGSWSWDEENVLWIELENNEIK